MYVVDDRHIWLFQPAPPPVISAIPWLWLVGITASKSITPVLIPGDRLPIFALLDVQAGQLGSYRLSVENMYVRLSNTSLFFKSHTHMHTQVDGSLMVISDWPMTSWLVFNVLLHGGPDNLMVEIHVRSELLLGCWDQDPSGLDQHLGTPKGTLRDLSMLQKIETLP